MSTYVTLCETTEIVEGQARAFPVADTVVALFRIGDQFFALEDGCPHAGASLALGDVDGNVVRCRIHHWGFCLQDGRYVDQDLPHYNARSFPVRVADAQIQVCVDAVK